MSSLYKLCLEQLKQNPSLLKQIPNAFHEELLYHVLHDLQIIRHHQQQLLVSHRKVVKERDYLYYQWHKKPVFDFVTPVMFLYIMAVILVLWSCVSKFMTSESSQKTWAEND